MKRTLLSWSSGKDSAWALYLLEKDTNVDLIGLFTVVNEKYDRVAMHAVRTELLQKQADALGFPLKIIHIPDPCNDEEYKKVMSGFMENVFSQKIEYMAYGDLFLQDIRNYRENHLKGTGIMPIFPLWNKPTKELAEEILYSGVCAYITCVDPRKMSPECIGQKWSRSLIDSLPKTVDPCGENGEFHTVVVDGPMFKKPVKVSVGEVIERDGFVFADIIP
jgi:uncharacterized protein (TIGR00290 family)